MLSGSGIRLPVIERGQSKYPTAVVEALCVFEIFRRLGFRPEEISVSFECLPVFKVILESKAETKKSFVGAPGRVGRRLRPFVMDVGVWVAEGKAEETWRVAKADWDRNIHRESSGWAETYRLSHAKRIAEHLLFMMLDRGFELPADVSNL